MKTWFQVTLYDNDSDKYIIITPYDDFELFEEIIHSRNCRDYYFKARPDLHDISMGYDYLPVDVYKHEKLIGRSKLPATFIAMCGKYIKDPEFSIIKKSKDQCTCDSRDLFHFGCRCGYIKK